ncbi:LysR family transcriptional regulator [Embleya sp. AB8]|uniref:LysR family transcriptional regulator n=1 Tax=Embleya sp. AB8 TaxID=3156304 RepID=UPI003C7083C8
MELRQLQYLVAVAEEGSFTRAAARLHVAQPGVSAQIRQLERELGQSLLDRSGPTVTPTAVGEAVLSFAATALGAVDGIRHVVDEYSGLLRGRVVLGMVSGAATHEFDVASILADFHDEHPGVEIALTEDTSKHMLTALRRGELHIALVGVVDTTPPPGVDYRIVVDEPLVAALAPDDPLLLSGRTSIPLTALRDRPLIGLPRGTGLRAVLERACAEAGFRPRVAFEAAAPLLLAQLAARGLGVAVVPALTPAQAAALGLRTLDLDEPRPRGRIALAWLTSGPAEPAARVLLDRLCEGIGGSGPTTSGPHS